MFDKDYILNHINNREYMSDIDRDRSRILSTAEVFTPTETVNKMLDKVDPVIFTDSTKIVLDQSAGDGQFLGQILIRRIQNDMDFEQALSTIYGVDLMQDNVDLCRERLLCGRHDLQHIVDKNIVCADSLRYHYRFDGSHPYDDEQLELEFNDRFDNLFGE